MHNYDVIIVGGGASGLFSASLLEGYKVLVIEKNNKIGKKLLLTGSGRCNILNLNANASSYYSDSPSIVSTIFDSIPIDRIYSYIENDLGILLDSKQDLVYPRTYRSSTVLNCLSNKISDDGVDIMLNEGVTSIVKNNDNYVINDQYEAPYLLIATGGKSYPQTGSDGSINSILKNFFTIIPQEPSLVPLASSDKDIRSLDGKKFKVSISYNNKVEEGELLFTKYGISGIAVMNLSSYYSKNNSVAYVDFAKEYSLSELIEIIDNYLKRFNTREITTALSGIIPEDLLKIVLNRSKSTNIVNIAKLIKNFPITIEGKMDFDKAQVTRGGISLKCVDDNLESYDNKGLFVIGEALNVDSICGGYNLTWAFISSLRATDAIKGRS